MGYFIILGLFTLVGWMVSSRLKSKFTKYSRIGIRSGLSGADVAQEMLRHYGVYDVKIAQGNGFLTDHYNPLTKTVTLSPTVYSGKSISAAAVAAHECGHAVQHATAYPMLQMRSNLVPVVQFSSKVQQYLFMGMMVGLGAGIGGNILLMVLLLCL